jgi:hypothetical protein
MQVAALYVDTRGVYRRFPKVDMWPIERDARKYRGPYPVIAHPPCKNWSVKLRHQAIGDFRDCGIIAIDQVRNYGGVLEQPANSKLFECGRLPLPGRSDAYGFTIELNQIWFGHCASKPTWLYFVRASKFLVQSTMPFDDTPYINMKKLSPRMRSATPKKFAIWMLYIISHLKSVH